MGRRPVKLMLDTTFVVDHLRDDPAAVERLDRAFAMGDDPLITSVVVSEVWAGQRTPADRDIELFLRYLEYVHAGPDTARLAGEWRADARRRGRTLTLQDALIAATAYDCGAAVLTRNVRDFALTPVRVETY
jgi:predicted nucleic acid-binding protein